ncbi:MAG: 1-acyl-sn-glycerol-3-phosphate acyltransferase [Pseudonocardia sp.]|nr:1-acyl-sn-glycerol-3-phosphate acyltransferase [Pseudonocardia sp.]
MTHPTHPGPVPDRPAWMPSSPCGDDCLPPRATGPSWRLAHRTVALATTLLAGVVALPFLPVLGDQRRDRVVRALFRAVLRAAGIELRIAAGDDQGPGYRVRDGRGVLVVANHLSWIDVVALGAVAPVRMLAKQEIADWPVIGGLARRCGTLFVDRAGLRGLPGVVAEITDALAAGAVVGVFPEGTTWCGSASGPFRRAAFQAALDAGVPVRPARLTLGLPDGRPTTVGAFVGQDTLWDSLSRVLRLPGLVCELTVLPALAPVGDRRGLARRAELAVTGGERSVTAPAPVAGCELAAG